MGAIQSKQQQKELSECIHGLHVRTLKYKVL